MKHPLPVNHEPAAAPGMKPGREHRLEEYLEIIWTLGERGENTLKQVHRDMGATDGPEMLSILLERDWIRVEGEMVVFQPEGERRARGIIRRHRLAERLLHDVLDVNWETLEENACRFEHVLSPDVTESICTFLGHPPTCPHGKPIPPDACCLRFKREITPLVRPLSELGAGQQGVITFIAPRYRSRLKQLSSLGIIPGTLVRLRQRHPSRVVEVGESVIALDKEIARNIYVRSRT